MKSRKTVKRTTRRANKRTRKASSEAGEDAYRHHAVVEGSKREPVKGAKWVRDADPTKTLELTLSLRGPKLPSADDLAGDPLTRAQFRKKYCASPRDVDKVAKVLKTFGLKVESTSLETRSMRISGKIGAVEAAFHARLGIYRSVHGEFRDREHHYKVPPGLDGIITAILGLSERWVVKKRLAAGRGEVALKPFGPADFERHYHFPHGDAAGQKIAIAEFASVYFADDVRAYCRKYKRKAPKVALVPIHVRLQNRASVAKMSRGDRDSALDDAKEVMMDTEIIAGLCPKAAISVYFAHDTQKGWVDMLDRVIKDRPVVFSMSWGATEDGRDWVPAAVDAINERLHVAAALGITICVSAGDDGSSDEQRDGRAHCAFPASSPFVLAVGGTQMEHNEGQLIERVWHKKPGRRTPNRKRRSGATGGGVSMRFDRPKWQDVKVKSLNKGSIDGRVVPDVTALSGPPWYAMVLNGKWTTGGGTSASAPLWAALIARINALLPKAKRQRFLTPHFYKISAFGAPHGKHVCHDITDGHNASIPHPGKGYAAGHGFDAASGWGTPVGTSLLLAL
jgi:kumamolisin